jgi:hypothetical protein
MPGNFSINPAPVFRIFVGEFNAYPETVVLSGTFFNFVHIYTLLYFIGYWCIYYCNKWQEHREKGDLLIR